MRSAVSALTLLASFAFLDAAVARQDDESASDWMEGHSLHGETFNAGPRQAAYLMGQGVSTQFPVTTTIPLAQVFFEQGVCQLHGFWYLEAERTFRMVADLDPDCAMAYWGMCMAMVTQDDGRAAGFAREAWLRREQATAHEQQYIDMWAKFFQVSYPRFEDSGEELAEGADPEKARWEYEEKKRGERKPGDDKKRCAAIVKDYEKLIYDYPDDIEAKAFLANRLWLNTRKGHSITSRMANQALLDQVFAVNPMHPAHHYRIHLWDTREEAYRVVDSAARCGQTAPGIAHLWHMAGHIYSRLDRHRDAAWQQEASARVDHLHMIRDQLLPDQIHNFAHNNEWCVRSLSHDGQVRRAIDLARNMIELPRHPKYNGAGKSGSSNYGRQRLLGILEQFELWAELTTTCNTMYLEPSDDPADQRLRAYTLGKAALAAGDAAGGQAQIDALTATLTAARADRAAKVDEAESKALDEGKKEDEVKAAMTKALEDGSKDVRELQRKIDALGALAALQGGGGDEEALKKLEEARFDKGWLSRLYLQQGNTEQAKKLARDAVNNHDNQGGPWANLAWILYKTDGAEAARESFETLRAFSACFDLDVPPFARLAPLASELGFAEDWRVADVIADDVGDRPDLDELGPFRWSPPPSKPWALPDVNGESVALADYAGRPVIVIFFLGLGCVHCVEQMQAFAPAVADFAEAGIEIVTIGTDSTEQLRASLDDEGSVQQLRILADPEMQVFKEWRCYDDFEEMPLHGTFLVDGDGDLRWWDVSFEPFLDHEFLLGESRRLLGLPKAGHSLAGLGDEPDTVEPAAGTVKGGSD